MKTVKKFVPSTKEILSDDELRFFHRVLVLHEKYGNKLKTIRFDDKAITQYLDSVNLSTPHDTKKRKIWIEETKTDCIQFKGSGNIGRRLVRFIRHAYAHNVIEKVNKDKTEERIHVVASSVFRIVSPSHQNPPERGRNRKCAGVLALHVRRGNDISSQLHS